MIGTIHLPEALLKDAMTVSYWQDDRHGKVHDEVDVVIIGGGIMGAASAYWLGKRKGLKVAIFEAQKLSAGASGRGAGFVVRTLFAYYNEAVKVFGREKARSLLNFNEESMRMLTCFVEEHGNNCNYERSGSFLLACTADELVDLQESAQLLAEDGFDVQYSPTDPLGRGYLGGIFNPGDIAIDTRLLVQNLVSVSGARILEGERVWRIEKTSIGLIQIESPGFSIRCSRMLFVTNGYAPLLEPWFADKIQPVRGQILVTKPLKSRILDSLVSANYGWDYFRQLPDNRFLLGGRRFMFRETETGYVDAVTHPLQSALQDYMAEYFPEAAAVPIEYRWSGLMAFTKDELPVLGELNQRPLMSNSSQAAESLPGAFYSVGCNGHGLGHSMGLAKLLVEMAFDGADPGVFGPSRLNESTNTHSWAHAQQPT